MNALQPAPPTKPFDHFRDVSARIPALAQRAIALPGLNALYAAIRESRTTESFATDMLRVMNVRCETDRHETVKIPRTGACVVMANHPFGGIEGIALLHVLQSLRPDVKVLANAMLAAVDELREDMIFVNPFQSSGSLRENLSGIRESCQWLSDGGMLVVFPAGEVASFTLTTMRSEEAPWSDTIARIARRSGASVVPCFIHGSNSVLFHALGCLHPRFRTAMLIRELLNKKNTTVSIRFAEPLSPAKVRSLPTDADVTALARSRSLLMKHKHQEERVDTVLQFNHTRIAEHVPSRLLCEDVAALDSSQILVTHGSYSVICATASEIPNLMREIYRLRELTFRYAGEGSGNEQDTDEFDATYKHLIVWNTATSEVVGAYRIGCTDALTKQAGNAGVYTSTLFAFKKGFFTKGSPYLELGRAFIRIEYQRQFAPLFLLWKGIGEFLVRHPQYRYLFGTVSISNSYSLPSKRLLVASLMEHHFNAAAASQVTPRTPLPSSLFSNWDGLLNSGTVLPVAELSDIISHLEHDDTGVPVLLRQYLHLGGEVIGFNVDRKFSNVIDALVVVDMKRTQRTILEKYMSPEGVERYYMETEAG